MNLTITELEILSDMFQNFETLVGNNLLDVDNEDLTTFYSLKSKLLK